VGVGGVVWYLQQPAQPELVASATVALPKVVVLEEASAVASAVAVETVASQVASVVAAEAVGAVVLNSASAPVAKASEVVAASKAELSIAVQQDSWVQVQDATGAKLVSELLKPGVVKSVAGVAPYRLKIGNAPYTQLTFRNKLVDLTTYTNGVVATFELK
jgi:cytoskeleton protein RodZ